MIIKKTVLEECVQQTLKDSAKVLWWHL